MSGRASARLEVDAQRSTFKLRCKRTSRRKAEGRFWGTTASISTIDSLLARPRRRCDRTGSRVAALSGIASVRDKFAAGAAILECPTWSSCYGLPLNTNLCLPAPLYCWTRCIEASYFFLRKRMIRGKRFARSKNNIVIGRCRTFAAEYLEIELATRQELLQLPMQLRLLLPFPPPCCVRDKMNTSDLNL